MEGIYMSLKLNLKGHRLGFIAQNSNKELFTVLTRRDNRLEWKILHKI